MTNHRLIQALRTGTVSLTRIQRIGFLFVGIACLLGGFAFLVNSPSVALEIESNVRGPLGTLVTIFSVAGVILIGIVAVILGLFLVGNVFWKAGGRS